MSCKVSIIVPVYNAEKYLGEMAESLYSQTLKEMEFIFVDDCSSDNSLNILYGLEKRDPERILVIKLEENQGAGGARNVGLKYASGDYIGFVDSDDYIKKEMYEELYNKAVSGNYDVVESGYFSERKNCEMMLWNEEMEGRVNLDKRVKMIMSCGFICTKIFKKNLILDSGVEFLKGIPLEDVDFLTRLYLRVNSVGIVNKSLYYYRNNEESFSNKRNGKGALHISSIFTENYLKHMKSERLYNIYKPVIEYVVISVWFDIYKEYTTKSKHINKESQNKIKQQLKMYIPEYKQNMFFYEKAKYDKLKQDFIS